MSLPSLERLRSVIRELRSSMSIADATELLSFMIRVGEAASRWGRWVLTGELPRVCSLDERRGAGEGEKVAIVRGDKLEVGA